MKIRKATQKDVRVISLLITKTIKEINSKYYSKEIIDLALEKNNLSNISKKMNEMFCFIDKGEILGIVYLEGNKIGGLFVKWNLTGKGIGKMLLKFIEEYAKKKNIYKLVLEPTMNAESFYEKFGYKKSGKIIVWKTKNCKINVPEMEKTLK